MHNQTLHASRFIDEHQLFRFDGQVEVEMRFHVTMLRYMSVLDTDECIPGLNRGCDTTIIMSTKAMDSMIIVLR
jgi:hypothetical protein